MTTSGQGKGKKLASVTSRRPPQTNLGTALRRHFAYNVRQLRRSKGITQAELAKAAGLGRPFLSQVEAGHFSVTLETLSALAEALGTTPTSLLASSAATEEPQLNGRPGGEAGEPGGYGPARRRSLPHPRRSPAPG